MKCPKCHSPMEEIEQHETQVDRCSRCGGLWFDAGESELLRKKKIALALDVGSETTGEHTNAIDRYPCPRCRGAMVKMVDPRQSHIWYEKCSSCGGSFFDAGEFRDLSTRTLSDIFKTLSVPERN